jgi:hypothetical protein
VTPLSLLVDVAGLGVEYAEADAGTPLLYPLPLSFRLMFHWIRHFTGQHKIFRLASPLLLGMCADCQASIRHSIHNDLIAAVDVCLAIGRGVPQKRTN